ncbi:hypothetical protein [Candidatus Leptofilum sp.]|uniref:hypothetical protein n=1 Tax=Candidatus Leptofilum sp. TaxID=3241576 RepID=UPI003B59FA36
MMERYRIELQSVLNGNWADWLGNLELTNTAQGNTVLIGEVVDQSALHGLLARIRDLGVPIVSIERLPATTESEL